MKTEREIMLSGKLYKSGDKELIAARKAGKRRVALYNQTAHEDEEQVQELLEDLMGKIGKDSYIEPDLYIDYGKNIYIGDTFYGNTGLTILDTCEVHIGNNVMIGPRVSLITAGHPIDAAVRVRGLEYGKPITIGDNVWIGGSSVIIPGVTLGNNVVVGAGSVVTKSFPDNVVIAGNPARVIKEIELEPNTLTPLAKERQKIDRIDKQIAQLLEERMNVVAEIAHIKKETKTSVLDNSREERVLEQVREYVENQDYADTIVETFKDVMKHSRTYQNRQLEE
jgi:maltose O-acetyltransferase